MITDPLRAAGAAERRSQLLRGFSHLSNPHLTVPGLSCVGVMPAAHRLALPMGRPHPSYGLRVGITMLPPTSLGDELPSRHAP